MVAVSFDIVVDSGIPIRTRSVNPDPRRGSKIASRGRHSILELGRDNQMFWSSDVDDVCKRGPREVRVQQRDDAAHTRDPEPYRHVFRAVRHQEADGLALDQALPYGPA